eukprot:5457095-Karenia_brevis.AAC.1
MRRECQVDGEGFGEYEEAMPILKSYICKHFKDSSPVNVEYIAGVLYHGLVSPAAQLRQFLL